MTAPIPGPGPRATRGYLNNNPGNMDRAQGEPWQGEVRDPNQVQNDMQRHELIAGRFCVFTGPEYGYRAMVKNLRAYRDRLGHRSIKAMIYQWAPPPKKMTGVSGTEANGEDQNDSAAYARSVAARLGVGVDDAINLEDFKTAAALCDAITRVECAGMPYTGKEIEDGLRLAGIVKPVTVAASSSAMATLTATGGVALNQAVTQLQGSITETVAAMAPVAAASPWLAGAIVALKLIGVAATLAGIGWLIYERINRQKRDEKIESGADASAVSNNEPTLTPDDQPQGV